MTKWAAQWAAEWAANWLPMGILPGKLVCPLLLYTCMKIVGRSVGSSLLPNIKKWAVQWAVEWAAHGNVAMQIRLPTTSIYGDSGQFSGQHTIFKYGKLGISAGSPLNCPLLNLKWKPSFIQMQDICSTCVYNASCLS